MTEEGLSSPSQILEIKSKDDLEKLGNVTIVKYVHIKEGNEDYLRVGSEKEVDHWQLVNPNDKKDDESTIVFNAGLIYWNRETMKGVLVGFSGGLQSEYGDFSKLQTSMKEKKLGLDQETVRILNERCGGTYFRIKDLIFYS